MIDNISSALLRGRRAALGALLACGLALAGCGGGGGDGDTVAPGSGGTPDNGGSSGGNTDTGGNGGRAKWTYLIYMAADNNLSPMAGLNVQQMMAAKSSPDVRVVVQVEQSAQYTQGADGKTMRGTVDNGATHLKTLGDVDMSRAASLTDFIRWGKQTYPADRYAVVLWSHGGGWKSNKAARGALQDLSSREAMMSLKDIGTAIRDAGGVDLVNFDACLMAMYEVAYELRGAAKVMVASEEVIPGAGNPYDRVINRMVANPSQDAVTLAKGIAQDYIDHYRATQRDSVTISAIDLTAIDALQAKVRATAASMVANMAGERLNIQAARDAATAYSYPNHHDLIAFAGALAGRANNGPLRTLAAELAAAARAAILVNHVQQVAGQLPVDGSTGLAVYLPSPADTTSSELALYRTAATSNTAATGETSWSDFVTALVTNGGGSGQTEASGPFAYGIAWDNPDVDLDLVVNEPQGNWAGPAAGATSVNGFSSADSWDSGLAEETYTANSQLEKGAYDVFVQYAGCARGKASCGSTTVSVYRYDPSLGDTSAVLLGSRRMDATPALPALDSFASFDAFIGAVDSDSYADWLYVRRVVRALPETGKALPAPMKLRGKGFGTGVAK